jgi:CubicO group peptidase (beta-lactamase class C family)
MNLAAALDRIGGADHVREQLEVGCRMSSVSGAALSIAGEDSCHCVAFGLDPRGQAFRATTAQEVGCAVKLLVATLLAPLIRNREVSIDDEVGRCLETSSRLSQPLFDGMRVRHLLSATDGMGYRAFSRTPVEESGFIDLRGLLEIICADAPTFEPGEYLTPSHAGYALLGVMLEKRFNEPLAQAINEHLVRHIATGSASDARNRPARGSNGAPVCPASGAGLRLSAAEWGEFLRFQMEPLAFGIPFFAGVTSFDGLFERQVTAPGWTGGLTGNALGWNVFPGGWVGRNGLSEAGTVLLRLNPERKLGFAFVCAGSVPIAYATLARLVGDVLPEFSSQNGPRMLTEEELRDMTASRYCGAFRSGSRTVVISEVAPRQLKANIAEVERGKPRTVVCSMLVPATQEIFFVPPPNQGIWFLQCVAGADPGHRLLWDGTTAWRNSEPIRA